MRDDREAMLRPEFREWYPTLRTDWWYPARVLAEIVLDQRRSREPHWEFEDRVPSNEHFLFRGGDAREDDAARTRRSDRLPGTHFPTERRRG